MEILSSRTEIRAGQAHKGKPGSVCAASDGHHHRLNPQLLHSLFCVVDQMHMLFNDLFHIIIGVFHRDLKGSLPVLLVEEFSCL